MLLSKKIDPVMSKQKYKIPHDFLESRDYMPIDMH